MSKCRDCGQELIFVQTVRGKWMPCDPGAVYFEEAQRGQGDGPVINQRGQLVTNAIVSRDPADGLERIGWIPHFATCPAEWEKKQRRKRAEAEQKQKLAEQKEAERSRKIAEAVMAAWEQNQARKAQLSFFD